MRYIIEALHNRPLIELNGNKYIVTPLNDHVPATSYELMDDIVKEVIKLTPSSHEVSKIVGEEDRGGFIASLIAYKLKLPFSLVKWNPIGIEGEINVKFRNAYTDGNMYLNGVTQNDNVLLVEDLVDSGGTIISMINLLQKKQINIVDVIAIAEKEELNGVKRIKSETGFDVKHLVKFSTKEKSSKVTWVLRNQ